MNILYLHTSVLSDKDVTDTLKKMDCNLEEFSAPSGEAEQDEEYVTKLLACMEEHHTDVVMSLRYFSIVSIVCNAMKVRYLSWVCTSYEPGLYSCTMLNACNYIFLADYVLYQEFASNDFPHIFYLPLGANVDRIKRIVERSGKEGEYQADVTMLQDIIPRESMPNNPLSTESPLKDATKGYLEGCIACQHQLSGLPSMAEHLPPYVWEDLTSNFVPEIGSDSIETAAHYYDYRYFNSLITYADRDIHLNTVAKNEYFKVVDLYHGYRTYQSDKVRCHERADYLTEVPSIVRQSKINLVITHRNWKSGIPQISWDIMAAGGFLLSNVQEDFLRLFPERMPVLYTEERELLSKAIYFLNHEKERCDLAANLSEIVVQKHTLKHRMETILASIL